MDPDCPDSVAFVILPDIFALYCSTRLSFSFADILRMTVVLSAVSLIWTPLQPFVQQQLGVKNVQMLNISVVCGIVSPLWGCLSVFWPSLGLQRKWQCYAAGLGYAIVSRLRCPQLECDAEESGSRAICDVFSSAEIGAHSKGMSLPFNAR